MGQIMNLTLKQWLELFEDGGCTEALRSRSAQIVEMLRSRTGNADRLLSIQSEDDIKDIFYDRLCDIYIGCFTELLSLEMGEAEFTAEIVMSDSVTPRLQQAVQALSDRLKEDADMIYRRFPFLRDIEEKITANFIESEVLLLDRYALSKEEISEKIFGGRPSGRILSFRKQRFFSRQHGRFVQGINTEAGVIYYKPHDCQVDALWRDIIMLGFSDITRAADVVWGKGYGFCNEIKAEPLEDINDARLYFFRFGALTAVLSVLGSIDIHKKNIMACGAWPVLIDTENLITPEAGLSDVMNRTAADIRIYESVLRMGTLPVRKCFEPYAASALYKDGEEGCSLPVWQGNTIDVSGYEQQFMDGFSEGYRRMLRLSEDIQKLLGGYPDMELRVLYNSPKVQGYFCDKYLSPECLKSREKQRNVMRRDEFALRRRGKRLVPEILDYEEMCYLEGDIPYYCVRLNEESLYGTDGKKLIEKEYRRTPYEYISSKLREYCDKDRLMEEKLVRWTFEHALLDSDEQSAETECGSDVRETERDSADIDCGSDVAEIKCDSGMTGEADPAGTLTNEIAEIFEKINKEKMITPDGRIFFLSASQGYYVQGDWGMAPLQAETVLFCGLVLRETKLASLHTAAEELIKQCICELNEKLAILEKEGIQDNITAGLRFGYGEMILAGLILKELSDDKICRRLLGCLTDKEDFNLKLPGISNGYAGLLIALCAVKADKSLITRYADKLAAMKITDNDPFTGLAGAGLAFAFAGEAAGDETCYVRSSQCFEKMLKGWNERLQGWPKDGVIQPRRGCYAAGIGLCALLAMDVLAGDKRDSAMECLRKAFRSEMNEEKLYRQDILENGNALRAAFLIKAASFFPEYDCKKRAGEIISAMITRKEKTGNYISSPDGMRNTFDMALFTGTLGVGAVMVLFLGRLSK
ncbi:MAG TPA: hypothetical protein DEO87_04675 [Lachnospiraceae bacterium]|nr:hypothetical protein [Lachnospiraceae bacterium]